MSIKNKFIFNWNDIDFIKDFYNYIYPIGLIENKKFNIDYDEYNNNIFIKKPELSIKNFIFNNKNIINYKFYKKIIKNLYLVSQT